MNNQKGQSKNLSFELAIGTPEAVHESAIKYEQGRIGLLLHVTDSGARERFARESIGLEYDLITATGLRHPLTREEYITKKISELDSAIFDLLSEVFEIQSGK